MKKQSRIVNSLLISFLVWSSGLMAQKTPVDYVNPTMGNISHLLVPTYPTVHLPNSILRVYPQRDDFTGDLLNGLPLIVTSHRGRSAFNLSPYQYEVKGAKGVIRYHYDQEEIKPYFYSVRLEDQDIDVRMAPSHQSGIYELNYHKKGKKNILLNVKGGKLSNLGDGFSGFQSLGNDTRVYLYLETDVKPTMTITLNDGNKDSNNQWFDLVFNEDVTKVNVRYGVSFISEAQAKSNLAREIKTFDVDVVAAEGRKIWNEALGKIDVKGGADNDKVVFYTSLYRVFERPVCISEDGRYFSGCDGKVHSDNGKPFYTDDWIWDTYRAAHPLRVLIEPQTEANILSSFVDMAGQMKNFWMPTFPEINGDSRRMNCNHAVASVLDAYTKGVRDFDFAKAYEACKGAITEKTLAPWSGAPAGKLDVFYHSQGYFPALNENEKETVPEVNGSEKRQAIAVTLGTSYDEWCLSQIAKILGKTDDYQRFLKASYNYRNVFNPQTSFFHPKNKDGQFIQPFNYVFSGGRGARDYYDENNGWTYRWDVQHNIGDLIKLMGGRENFVKNLDSMFYRPLGRSKFDFYYQFPDQTGNVGQFTMANEPSLHIPYLYNYAGEPWKTQKRIRSLLNEWFRNDLMGVPGDEDGGGMSAFVVFSKLGFYPVTPGSPTYNIGSPAFEQMSMTLGNGKEFKIIAKNCSDKNKYIQSAKLNGKEWNQPWFSHKDISEGGILELVMGDLPNKSWGCGAEAVPPSAEEVK